MAKERKQAGGSPQHRPKLGPGRPQAGPEPVIAFAAGVSEAYEFYAYPSDESSGEDEEEDVDESR